MKLGASLVLVEATLAPSPGRPLPMWNGNPLTGIRPFFLQNAFAFHPLCPELSQTLLDRASWRPHRPDIPLHPKFSLCLDHLPAASPHAHPAPPFESWESKPLRASNLFLPWSPLATSEVDRILRNEDDLTSTAICRRSTTNQFFKCSFNVDQTSPFSWVVSAVLDEKIEAFDHPDIISPMVCCQPKPFDNPGIVEQETEKGYVAVCCIKAFSIIYLLSPYKG